MGAGERRREEVGERAFKRTRSGLSQDRRLASTQKDGWQDGSSSSAAAGNHGKAARHRRPEQGWRLLFKKAEAAGASGRHAFTVTQAASSVAHPQRADQTSVTARAQRAGKADARQKRRRGNSEGSVPSLAPREPVHCPAIRQACCSHQQASAQSSLRARTSTTCAGWRPRQTLQAS